MEVIEFVKDRLKEEAPANIVQAVVDKVLVATQLDNDSDAGVGRELTTEMLEKLYANVRMCFSQPYIEAALQQKGLASKTLTEQLVKHIADCNTANDLQAAINSEDAYVGMSEMIRNALQKMIANGAQDLTCSICMEPMVDVCSDRPFGRMWSAPVRRNEHWNNHSCGHIFCRSCITSWSEAAIEEQKVRVKCPAHCCNYSLWDQDLRELVSPLSFSRYQERKHADYLGNLRDIAGKDSQLMQWLRRHARPCPDCHVIVSKSEGCDAMTCVCGTRFCYACGCKGCVCRSKGDMHNRTDIWNPEAEA